MVRARAARGAARAQIMMTTETREHLMNLRKSKGTTDLAAQGGAARLGPGTGTSRGLNVEDPRPVHVIIQHRDADLIDDASLAEMFEMLRESWGAVKKKDHVSRVVIQNFQVRARPRARASPRFSRVDDVSHRSLSAPCRS